MPPGRRTAAIRVLSRSAGRPAVSANLKQCRPLIRFKFNLDLLLLCICTARLARQTLPGSRVLAAFFISAFLCPILFKQFGAHLRSGRGAPLFIQHRECLDTGHRIMPVICSFESSNLFKHSFYTFDSALDECLLPLLIVCQGGHACKDGFVVFSILSRPPLQAVSPALVAALRVPASAIRSSCRSATDSFGKNL